MDAVIQLGANSCKINLSQPIDISIPLRAGAENVNAFHIPPVIISPFQIGSFIGDVNQGGACNVNNIIFNPHGNGTHTECVGHISTEPYTINQSLKTFFFLAQLITITPELQPNGDFVITADSISAVFKPQANVEALIIRTLPNTSDKLNKQYSGTNPPYLHHEVAAYCCTSGIKHLLLDLPSVDREDDGGVLSAHHAFWQYPHKTRTEATITELIYVPNTIADGLYMLNLQIASFENDASPSKPLLFALQ